MFYVMIIAFIIGYACIAFEHPLQINKSATALLLGTIMWILFIVGDPSGYPAFSTFQNFLSENPDSTFASWLTYGPLLKHLGEIAEILFFLLGAMTVVEIIDTHGGFKIITDRITTTKKTSLLWIIALITFFMSAALDNLTTAIVMIALLRKLITDKTDRWIFAGIVILASNSGGAWSPIGDVTTIMLWIGGQISATNIILTTIIPSLVSIVIPVIFLTFKMKGHIEKPDTTVIHTKIKISRKERNFVFFLGTGVLLFVPIFKTITHLPPYLGMLGGLGILWICTELLNKRSLDENRNQMTISSILQKIDTPSILFFLGILMAVAAMQTCGQLSLLSQSLDSIPMEEPGKHYLIVSIIGILSSIVDNVPLVAGAIGMYEFPTDHYFWSFLAYAAGTGGSILIIGSAAGVAVMGMEKIDFIWYLKRISLLAFIGYLSGCGVYILQKMVMG